MGDPATGRRAGALADVAYLARSANRFAVLEHLSEERFAPSELVELTGASRPTLGRVLGELEERGWARRTDGGYVATPSGRAVVSTFDPLLGAMAVIDRLGDAVDWLPREEVSIDLHHFADATVRAPERDDPVEALDFITDRLRSASEWTVLTNLLAPPQKQRAMLEGVECGRLDATNVLTADVIERVLARPEWAEWAREYVASGARVYRYDGSLPCNLFVIDDLVLIMDSDPGATSPYTAVVSENEAVGSWAREVVEHYRAEAERVTSEDVTSATDESAEPVDEQR